MRLPQATTADKEGLSQTRRRSAPNEVNTAYIRHSTFGIRLDRLAPLTILNTRTGSCVQYLGRGRQSQPAQSPSPLVPKQITAGSLLCSALPDLVLLQSTTHSPLLSCAVASMGAASKISARLVTSTIVVTFTDSERSTSSEEPTGTADSSERSTTRTPAPSIPTTLPVNFASFTTSVTDFKPSATAFLSAAPSVVTSTQTIVVSPSSGSSVTQTTQTSAQSHGLSQRDIIIISSAAGGGAVLLALLAGIVFCLVRRRKRRELRESSENHSSYGPSPATPFNLSLKGAAMSQEKSFSTHSHKGSAHGGSQLYVPEHDHQNASLYYDGHAHNVVGQRHVSTQMQDRVIIAPQRDAGGGSTPLLHARSPRMGSPIDPEMEEQRRLNARPMRGDETPPPSASPLGDGYGYGRGDGYSPYSSYGEYAPYGHGYAYTSEAPSSPIVHPAISLADAIPARAPIAMYMPAPVPAVTASTATTPEPQQQQRPATMEASSSSFEYPSWLRMGLDSGAIASVASSSAIPAEAAPSVIPTKLSTKRKSAIALAPIVIPEYTPRARAATVSTPSSRYAPARRPEPTTPLPAPPPRPAHAPIEPAPAQVISSTTHASIVTRKNTKARRSLKRGKGAYQTLDSPGPSPAANAGEDATKRADSPGAYSDGGDSASMYSQSSAAHVNEHNRSGLELSDSTILAFPLMMRQNPPPLPHPRAIQGPSSPSMSPSMSLPNDVFSAGMPRPRQDVRATIDTNGDVDDTITMRVADLIQSRVRRMRSVAPPERTGSVVSHIERAGSIKPASGLHAVGEDGVDDYNEGDGTTRPLRIGAGRVAGAKVRMARMKRAAAAMDVVGPGRPLQDGTNIK